MAASSSGYGHGFVCENIAINEFIHEYTKSGILFSTGTETRPENGILTIMGYSEAGQCLPIPVKLIPSKKAAAR